MAGLLLMWRRGNSIIDYKRKAIEKGKGHDECEMGTQGLSTR